MQFYLYINPLKNIVHTIKIHLYVPKSSESQVDVSVPVMFVANVDADSVDVLIVVSAVDAIDDPITITFVGFCEAYTKMKINK